MVMNWRNGSATKLPLVETTGGGPLNEKRLTRGK